MTLRSRSFEPRIGARCRAQSRRCRTFEASPRETFVTSRSCREGGYHRRGARGRQCEASILAFIRLFGQTTSNNYPAPMRNCQVTIRPTRTVASPHRKNRAICCTFLIACSASLALLMRHEFGRAAGLKGRDNVIINTETGDVLNKSREVTGNLFDGP